MNTEEENIEKWKSFHVNFQTLPAYSMLVRTSRTMMWEEGEESWIKTNIKQKTDVYIH